MDTIHCENILRDSWIFFNKASWDGLGKLIQARESLVSDIPAGDGNIAKPFFTVYIHVGKKIRELFAPIKMCRSMFLQPPG